MEFDVNGGFPLRRLAVVSLHGCPLVTPGARSAGGMSVYLRQVAWRLARQGVCVDIFTRSHQAGGPELPEAGERVRVIHLPGGAAELDKEEVVPYLPDLYAGMRSFALAHGLGYDLVHSHYWLSGWAGERLARDLGVPHVATFHTLALVKESAYEERESEERKQAEAAMASADRVVVFTEEERGHMERLYGIHPERVSVAPSGVDLDRFRPGGKAAARRRTGLDPDTKTILYVGRLEPFKGPDVLVRALAAIPKAALVVAGGGPVDEGAWWLRRVAEEAGVSERVVWRDAMPQERLPDYYVAADLLAVPSRHESFGHAALEAMACGTPVVAADAGGLREVVANGVTGRLVAGHDPADYAAALTELLRDDERRAQMGAEAPAWARRFGWERACADLRAAYGQALARWGQRAVVQPCVG
ncbi:MAG: glycosyltransferase [Chloroflexota bacterium]|nr:glycosyltransferase [Chloroflexota bacterium]